MKKLIIPAVVTALASAVAAVITVIRRKTANQY